MTRNCLQNSKKVGDEQNSALPLNFEQFQFVRHISQEQDYMNIPTDIFNGHERGKFSTFSPDATTSGPAHGERWLKESERS